MQMLTQKTEEPKGNKGNLTFPSHAVNMTELESNKKVATPPPLPIKPPFTGLSPLSSKKFCIPPQVIQFLDKKGGAREGGVPTMMNPNDVMVVVLKYILCLLGFRFIYIVYIS